MSRIKIISILLLILFSSITLASTTDPTITDMYVEPEEVEVGEEVEIYLEAQDTGEMHTLAVDWGEGWEDKSCDSAPINECSNTWSFEPEEEGAYNIRGRAIDGYGNTDQDSVSLNVVDEKEPISLNLETPPDSAEDVIVRPSFEWDMTGGEGDLEADLYVRETDYDTQTPWSNPDYLYEDVSSPYEMDDELKYDTEYVWGVEVTDEEDQSVRDHRYFTTKEKPEADINADFDFNPEDPIVDEEIKFDASASEADNEIIEYDWDFGDSTSTKTDSKTIKYSYSEEGDYDVSLTIEDNEGNTDSAEKTVSVEERERCGIDSGTVGSLELEDSRIDKGDSTEASIDVENEGDSQDVNVKITADGETYLDSTETVDSDSSRTFSADVSPERDTHVEAEVRTVGDPCGDQDITTSTELLRVVTPIGDEEAELKVNVTDKELKALEDARVKVENSDRKIKYTDSEGITQFKLTPDRYSIDVSKQGYKSESDNVRLEDGDSKKVDFQLEEERKDDPKECGVSSRTVGDLRLEDSSIHRGDSTEASIDVENEGDIQDVRVEIKADGELYDRTTKTLDTDETRTFSADVSPEKDSYVEAKVYTEGSPCGDRLVKTDYEHLKVLTPIYDDLGELEVEVKDKSGDELEDARIDIDNSESKTGFTDRNGLAEFKLEPNRYSVEASKPGYSTESKSVNIREGDKRTLRFQLEKLEDKSVFTAVVRDSRTDERLEDANVKLENGETYEKDTDSRGRASFNVKPDEYDVNVSKENYESSIDSIELDEGDRKTRNYYLRDEDRDRGVRISSIDYSESVCRGDTLEVETEIENLGGYHETVTLTGSGLGVTTVSSSFPLSENQTETRTFRFTNVEGDGEEEFRLTATNRESDSVTSTVKVEDCEVVTEDREEIRGLTAELNPREVTEGDTVRVSGYVRGVRDSTTVNIDVEGQERIQIATERDGYYSTYIRPERTGKQSVTVSAGDKSASRTLEVLPTSRVESVDAPRRVFEGETFEVCTEVSSQATPRLTFERNDRVLETRDDVGEVCFEDTAEDPGTHVYTVNSFTHDQVSTGSTEVEVLEKRSETEMFPDRFASVRSGSGIIKVDLYNSNHEQKLYNLEISGIDDRWVTQSEKEVILNPGEAETAYFYFTPRAEGEFRPEISVEKEGEVVYSEEVIMEIGGRDRPESSGWRDLLVKYLPFL